ncbi:MAG: SDR family NAD(P)-dependent oxidoreductase [Myxococcaceae bacterium]
MKAVIVGGTKGMGRALARILSERGDQLFLLGRDEEELKKSAADLGARGGSTTPGHGVVDLEAPEGFDKALDEADNALTGGFDLFVVTAALFGQQERLESDEAFLHRLLTVNFANTVLLAEKARKRMLSRGGGTLCLFSSVAGDRGRKPVVLYGSTKAGISAYCEGLDHKYRAQGLRTVCVKPGFVKTGMTEGLKPPPFAGEPDQVARRVAKAIDAGKPVVYAPPMWWLVMTVIRSLPRFVMRKLSF